VKVTVMDGQPASSRRRMFLLMLLVESLGSLGGSAVAKSCPPTNDQLHFNPTSLHFTPRTHHVDEQPLNAAVVVIDHIDMPCDMQ